MIAMLTVETALFFLLLLVFPFGFLKFSEQNIDFKIFSD